MPIYLAMYICCSIIARWMQLEAGEICNKANVLYGVVLQLM